MQTRLVLSVLALGALSTACGEQNLNFGEPLGLRPPRPDTDVLCELPPDPARQCPGPSWNNVYDLLVQPKYGCAEKGSGCHGVPNQRPPYIPPPDVADAANIAKTELENFSAAGTDVTYIGAADSYIMCNIWQATPTPFGTTMPLLGGDRELIVDQDLLDIANWFYCEYGGGAGGNGAGGGGTGGGGGAGGMGAGGGGTGGGGGAGGAGGGN